MDGYDGRIEVEGCDTIPRLFWHQVKGRDQRTAFREKKLGIWRATSWHDYGDPMVMPLAELMVLGRDHDKASPGEWDKRVAASSAEELALLVYTSGTTGPPKGAMISHRNIIFQLRNADAFIPLGTHDEQL